MELTFAHYRNRFCMFRTYYALATGKVKPDGLELKVIELPDPPSREQEEALIRGNVQVANVYLPNFLQRKLEGAPIIGLSTDRNPPGRSRDSSLSLAPRLRRG
jgi:hypothetical protein